jgi:hypothetical protein
MKGIRCLGWGAALSALLCALALMSPTAGLAARGPGFKAGTYKGKTNQGLPITLRVSSSAVPSIQFDWRARCADGKRHRNTILVNGGRIHRRSFFTRGVLDTGGKFSVKGKLRGRVAWGNLSRWGPSAFGTFNCPARGVRWRAHRVAPEKPVPKLQKTLFSGRTSQGLAISFLATSTDVLYLTFGWTAHCEDGQTHMNSIAAGGSPIDQSGGFSMGGVLNTGGLFQVDGTIDGTTASGTLSRSGPSAFGTFDCTAAGVTWQAQASNTRR